MAKKRIPMRNSRALYDMANAEAKQKARENFVIASQMALDSAVLAAHDVLGLGPGRAKEFIDSFNGYFAEISGLILDGSASGDTELSYLQERLDGALKAIEGDAFHDWMERYNR